jgi:chemotaxis protein CheD
MNNIIYVNSGEVKHGRPGATLNSGAIGSCVVVTVYDPNKKAGAMAHIMLPGRAPDKLYPEKDNDLNKYSENAIESLTQQMTLLGSQINTMEACLVGGANVLKRKGDSISNENILSIINLLAEKNIKIMARSVGGTERRTASFNIEKGCLYYTIGDSEEKLLYSAMGI